MSASQKSKKTNIDQKITVGDITNAKSIAIGHGSSAINTESGGAGASEIGSAFADLYQALQQVPATPKKTMATQVVQSLEEEAKKGNSADEGKVSEWFDILMSMLPDIGEVAINTFINPIQGLSIAFQMIAQQAKEKLAKGNK